MATQFTSDAEIVEALRLIRQNGGVMQASRASDIPESTLKRRRDLAKSRGLTADSVLENASDRLKLEVSRLKRELAGKQAVEDSAAAIRETIYEIAAYDPAPPKWLTQTKKGSGTPGTPMTNWSDWHYGEVVRSGEVGGLNEYNSSIAAERIQRLADRTIRLVKGFAFKEAGKAVEFPGIVVGLGGDMISGFIHEEIVATNDRTPNQCIDELTDLIAAALTQLAGEFGNVFVPCVVGNHGRTTHKPRMKQRVFTSFEWNLYCSLARYFKARNDDRVKFEIPEGSDCRFVVQGNAFLWTHGDSMGTRAGDAVTGALLPIMRGMMKVARSYAEIAKPVDHIVIGHWHQELWLPLGNVNNSLKGDDEYARLVMRAPHSRPSQNLWFVHEEQGITARLAVYVDNVKKARKKAPWIVVP